MRLDDFAVLDALKFLAGGGGFMKSDGRALPSLAFLLVAVTVLTALTCPALAGGEADQLVGNWVTPGNDRIRVFKQGDRFFAKPFPYPWQEPRLDVKNPDPALRSRILSEALILENFRYDAGKWVDGTAYDPNNGKTYRCEIRLQGEHELALRGYIGIPLFGRTEIWRREGAFLGASD